MFKNPISRVRATGLWTSDRLYLWSQGGEQYNYRSVIYYVQLETGVATAIDFAFDNYIGRLYLSYDKFLHIRNDNYIGHGKRDKDGNFVQYSHDATWGQLTSYRFFRIPIR